MVYLACLAAGKLGLLTPPVGSHVALFWLAAGIAIAAILRWGFISVFAICLPGILYGQFLDRCTASTATQMSVGHLIGSKMVAMLLQHFDFKSALDCMRTFAAACIRQHRHDAG